jgi:hypothetical protein
MFCIGTVMTVIPYSRMAARRRGCVILKPCRRLLRAPSGHLRSVHTEGEVTVAILEQYPSIQTDENVLQPNAFVYM